MYMSRVTFVVSWDMKDNSKPELQKIKKRINDDLFIAFRQEIYFLFISINIKSKRVLENQSCNTYRHPHLDATRSFNMIIVGILSSSKIYRLWGLYFTGTHCVLTSWSIWPLVWPRPFSCHEELKINLYLKTV